MTTIQISGHPLETPLRFDDVTTDTFENPAHWLLTQPQAARLVQSWREAPTEEVGHSRASVYSQLGVFVTALYIEGELTTDEWESVAGSGDAQNDLYSTSTMPFDFTIAVVA